MFCILLIVAFSFSLDNQALGQEKVNISAGIGVPEVINIGVRYQLEQVQLGISCGIGSIEFEIVLGSVYYHFAGFSELSDRRPWYVRRGVGFWRSSSFGFSYLVKPDPEYSKSLDLRIGRDINISPRVGINIDAGAGYEFGESRDFAVNGSAVFPSFGVAFFIRI